MNHRAAMVRIAFALALTVGLLETGARATSDVYPSASWDRIEAPEGPYSECPQS